MSFSITRDPDAFTAAAGRFLERHIECHVMATVLIAAREGAYRDADREEHELLADLGPS